MVLADGRRMGLVVAKGQRLNLDVAERDESSYTA